MSDGTHHVTFVAQHNAEHSRHGKPKAAEPHTGDIAKKAAETCGSTSRHIVQEEPITFNDDDIDKRYDDVANRIHKAVSEQDTIIDIHGMTDDHGSDVVIGTGAHTTPGEGDLADRVKTAAEKSGLTVSVNAGEFDATANWTVSGYAESHAPYPDPTVLQVELSRSVRDNRSDEVAALLAHAVCM